MNNIIEKIFKDFIVNGIKIPVEFNHYDGKEKTYLTYENIGTGDTLSTENEISYYIDYYDIDIYSNKNYLAIEKEVKRKMKEQGFMWQPTKSSPDLYEFDTEMYHKTLCFAIERKE